jgi:D-serine deaminase-like pyridoxal phosphate-dependent protein
MQKKADSLGVVLRPHIKTHKCVEIASRQRQLGARGITVSTFYEAEYFAGQGFDDVIWAFPIPLIYVPAAVKLAQTITFRIVVDSLEATERLKRECRAAGARVHVWLKVDCGYHRAGVDPQSRSADDLVRLLSESSVFEFDGILSHSGHAYNGKSVSEILAAANQERSVMSEFAERLRSRGYRVPGVSIGSTPSMVVIKNLDGVTEVRPGNYCFFDQTMVALGVCQVADCAVTVLASVMSHQKGSSHFLTDAGALALSKDGGPAHTAHETGMGSIYVDYLQTRLNPDIRLQTLSQEHGKISAAEPELIEGRYPVGSTVRILENHSCLTVAHFDEYNVVRGDEVIGRWKIARGRA